MIPFFRTPTMAFVFIISFLGVLPAPTVDGNAQVIVANGSFTGPGYGPNGLHSNAPWFAGWYTRITDDEAKKSIVVIGGSQYLPETSLQEACLPGYLAVIIHIRDQTVLYEAFPHQTSLWSSRDRVLDDPCSSDWLDFEWYAEGYGMITNKVIDIQIADKVGVFATLYGERLPWNTKIPWLGPEGIGEFLSFIPLHWFVYTLGTDTTYSYTLFNNGNEVTTRGFGFAHQESNWGKVFPPAWVWSQGVSGDNTHQFALSGGELAIVNKRFNTWLLAYHSPRLKWEFRPTIPGTVYTQSVHACTGMFEIRAADAARMLVVTANAPVESFFPVSVPTDGGFQLGAAESMSATVTISAYKLLPGLDAVLIDQCRFENAALEFGGEYLCAD